MGMSNLDGYHPNKNESYQLGYQQGRADERKGILEHQTIIYDLDGIGHKVVLVKDIKVRT